MLHSHVRMAGVVLAALLALVGVAACGEDEGAAPPPVTVSSDTPTPSATADPGPAEPTLPAAATKPGRKGAIAFVTYYWAVVDYAQATGDTTLLRSIQNSRCEPCSGGTAWITDVYNRGGKISGGEHELTRLKAWSDADSWLVQARLESSPQRISNAGKLNEAFDGGVSVGRHTVGSEAGAWVMYDWDLR